MKLILLNIIVWFVIRIIIYRYIRIVDKKEREKLNLWEKSYIDEIISNIEEVKILQEKAKKKKCS